MPTVAIASSIPPKGGWVGSTFLPWFVFVQLWVVSGHGLESSPYIVQWAAYCLGISNYLWAQSQMWSTISGECWYRNTFRWCHQFLSCRSSCCWWRCSNFDHSRWRCAELNCWCACSQHSWCPQSGMLLSVLSSRLPELVCCHRGASTTHLRLSQLVLTGTSFIQILLEYHLMRHPAALVSTAALNAIRVWSSIPYNRVQVFLIFIWMCNSLQRVRLHPSREQMLTRLFLSPGCEAWGILNWNFLGSLVCWVTIFLILLMLQVCRLCQPTIWALQIRCKQLQMEMLLRLPHRGFRAGPSICLFTHLWSRLNQTNTWLLHRRYCGLKPLTNGYRFSRFLVFQGK